MTYGLIDKKYRKLCEPIRHGMDVNSKNYSTSAKNLVNPLYIEGLGDYLA
jgi:hypothetical protein